MNAKQRRKQRRVFKNKAKWTFTESPQRGVRGFLKDWSTLVHAKPINIIETNGSQAESISDYVDKFKDEFLCYPKEILNPDGTPLTTEQQVVQNLTISFDYSAYEKSRTEDVAKTDPTT